MREDGGTLSEEQLGHPTRYFNEEVPFSRHIGAKVEEVGPGRSVISIAVEDIHLNGAGTLHGRVYASLIDTSMGLSVLALVGVRTATTQMNVHFLGAVNEGAHHLRKRGRPPHPPNRHGRGEGPRRGGQSRRHGYRRVPRVRAEG